MFSNQKFVCLLVSVCAVSFSLTGCRNQCAQPTGFPFQQFPQQQFPQQQFPQQQQFQQFPQQQQFQQFPQQQQFFNQSGGSTSRTFGQPVGGLAGRSPIIAPPPTNSLNIPSIARNNPFGSNGGLINTGQAAPTPADRTSQFNRDQGWRASDEANNNFSGGSSSSGSTSGSASATTIGSASRSQPPQVGPSNANSVLVQDTQSRNNRGYGDSFVSSTDYSTTAVNETFDRTRLPATDASAVRAPSQFYTRATGAQVAQLAQQGFAGVQQPYYSGTFQATPNISNGSGTSQPIFAANNRTALVQGQSTATFDPYGDTRSADWRNRDASGGNFQ